MPARFRTVAVVVAALLLLSAAVAILGRAATSDAPAHPPASDASRGVDARGERANGVDDAPGDIPGQPAPAPPAKGPPTGEPSMGPPSSAATVSANVRVRVLDPHGSPAAGARVELQAWTGPGANNSQARNSVSVVTVVRAAADGAGEAVLECELATEADGSRMVQAVASFDGFAPGYSVPARLDAHDAAPLLTIKLLAAATVIGRLVDSTPTPVPGATVRLFLVAVSQHQPIATCISDADGRIQFKNVPAQMAMIEVRAAGLSAPWPWDTRFQPQTPLHDLGDIRLAATGILRGRILDARGDPVAGAAVCIDKVPTSLRRQEQTYSGADGGFEFGTVVGGTGQYQLVVRAAGCSQKVVTGVSVQPRQVTDLGDVRLDAGLVLTAVVDDGQSEPVAGATVRVFFDGELADLGIGWQQDHWRATTDRQGRAVVSSLSPGPAQLVVSAKGFASHTQALEIERPETIRVALARGGTVTGLLRHDRGPPAALAQVGLISHRHWSYEEYKKGGLVMRDFGWARACARPALRTAAEGRFTITDLAAGSYLLVAVDARGESLLVYDGVTVTAGATTELGELALPLLATLIIEVTDGGAPAAGIELLVAGGALRKYVTTDGIGQAELRGVDAGDYQVLLPGERADRGFAAMRARRVAVAPGETTRVKLEFPGEGVRVSGTFTLAGAPLFRSVMAQGQGVTYQTELDARGRYVFLSVLPGEYEFALFGPPGGPAPFLIRVAAAEGARAMEVSRDFKAANVSGRVTRADGTAAGVDVRLQPLDGSPGPHSGNSVKSGPDGAFKFENVALGRWRIGVSAVEGVAQADFEVSGVDVSGLELKLAPAGSVCVVIETLVGNASFSGHVLRLRDSTGALVGAGGGVMPTAGARAVLHGVAPGTYTLEMTGYGYVCKFVPGVVVSAGKQTDVPVTLQAAASAELVLSGPGLTAEDIARTSVQWLDAEGRAVVLPWPFGRAKQLDDFVLQVPDLMPEVAVLLVRVPGFADARVAVRFVPADKLKHDITLQR